MANHQLRYTKHDHRAHVPDWYCFVVSENESYSFSRKQLIDLPDGTIIETPQWRLDVIDRFIVFTAPNGCEVIYDRRHRDGSIYADELRDREEQRERGAITSNSEPANDNECLEVMEDEYSYRDSCLIRSNWKKWLQ